MPNIPNCPVCESTFTYVDPNDLYVCPMCNHVWSDIENDETEEVDKEVLDSNGNALADGDTVVVIKDLHVSGKEKIKQGTKAKNIRILTEPVNNHNIECTIDGFGRIYLKSEFVKK